MKAKTAMLVGLVLSIAAMAEATPIDSNAIVQDGIEYYMQTDKSVYDLGEEVEMLYRVTNLGDEDTIVGWVVADPLAYYDFRVMQGSSQIWQYPYMSVVLGFEPFDLGPYESKEFQTVWNMMNDNGTPSLPNDDFPVNPGIYDIIGELDLVPSFGGERVPVSVQIEIIPETATTYYVNALNGDDARVELDGQVN